MLEKKQKRKPKKITKVTVECFLAEYATTTDKITHSMWAKKYNVTRKTIESWIDKNKEIINGIIDDSINECIRLLKLKAFEAVNVQIKALDKKNKIDLIQLKAADSLLDRVIAKRAYVEGELKTPDIYINGKNICK